MKRTRLFAVLVTSWLILGCNNNDGGEKDPSVMQPPSEAIPDSMKIINDSVIGPDTTPGNGKNAGNSDSIQKNR